MTPLQKRAEKHANTLNDMPMFGDVVRAWLAGYRAARRDARLHRSRMTEKFTSRSTCDNPNGPCACGAWHKDGE